MAQESGRQGSERPRFRRRDLVLAAAPLALLGIQMSLRGHLRGGVLLGLVLVVLLTVGLLGLLGDSPLDLRGDESAPSPGDARPWYRREGALVVLFGVLLFVPLAGAFGLWDPWETHYSEVAREILARDDWITLWRAQEGWFVSKPIGIFWLSALGMGVGTLFGLNIAADAGPGAHEWFIRLPVIALAIAAMYALYRAVAAAFGKRAGLLVALVLATMPHWFFLAHQAMTDMPFVAALTIGIAMFLLGLTAEPGSLVEARVLRVGPWTLRVSLWHLTVGAVLLCALPQIVYLLTRPMVLSCPADAGAQCERMLAMNRLGRIQFPVEAFYLGSPGNSGTGGLPSVPGSPTWERVASAVPFMPSVLQGLFWIGLLAWLLAGLRRERSVQGLYFALLFLWCAVSTMAKGPAGIVIPVALVVVQCAATGRWRGLTQLRFGTGLLVFLVVGMPWFLAVTGRLGNEFIERFIMHDIINRTVMGVHGDTGSLRYFLVQLGYAMFPWSGLVPVALVGWRTVLPERATPAQKDVALAGMLWFLLSFVLFSAMVTKFHHYIFPALPGAAILVGLLLDRMLGSPSLSLLPSSSSDEARGYRDGASRPCPQASERNAWLSLGALTAGTALVVVGVATCVGSWRGILPARGTVHGNVPLGVLLALGGAALWAVGRSISARGGRVEGTDRGVALGAAGLGAAVVVGFVARDLVIRRSTPPGFERLIHLFVYNYDRPWPTRYLDYHAVLTGFGAAAVLAMAMLAVGPWRAYAARGTVVLASLFAVWALDVYMMDLTPHWSQRGLFARYYAMRRPRPRGTGEGGRYTHDPIAAYQMNWKGENFYTGNHVVALECGLKYCQDRTPEWLGHHHGERVFFVTEHSRVSGLLSQVRQTGGDGHTVTTEADDNKFVLVEVRVGHGGRSTPPAATPAARLEDRR